MKHLVEMVELENEELASVRKQHEAKVEEVKHLQQQAFEGRDEVERVKSEADRKKTEVDRYKQVKIVKKIVFKFCFNTFNLYTFI